MCSFTISRNKRFSSVDLLQLKQPNLFLRLLMLCGLCLFWGIPSAQTDPDAGYINIESASFERSEAGIKLDAVAELNLSREIRLGLDSGVPLQFILQLRILKSRRFLPDAVFLGVQKRYTLTYYELTRHYRVQSIDTLESHNYRSLFAALTAMGNLESVEFRVPEPKYARLGRILKPLEGQDNARHYGELTFKLDSKALPLPLQPVITKAWRLASKEYLWQLN